MSGECHPGLVPGSVVAIEFIERLRLVILNAVKDPVKLAEVRVLSPWSCAIGSNAVE